MTLDIGLAALSKLKTAVEKKDNTIAASVLEELKEILLNFDSLPPLSIESPCANQERSLACDVFEYGVIFSVNSGDKESFQRYLDSLRPYYLSYNDSKLKYQIIGLYLLFLLVENRLSEFHAELELLTEEEQLDPAISFCTQLDRHLMVGSYAEIMSEAAHPPIESYRFFLRSLQETVRVNIGESMAASYSKLTFTGAKEILMFDSVDDTISFINSYHPKWVIDSQNQQIVIQGDTVSQSEKVPALRLISQALSYATEIERIV